MALSNIVQRLFEHRVFVFNKFPLQETNIYRQFEESARQVRAARVAQVARSHSYLAGELKAWRKSIVLREYVCDASIIVSCQAGFYVAIGKVPRF